MFACLCSEKMKNGLGLMRDLACTALPPPLVLHAARSVIRRSHKEVPRVLDMFGGGGTIPFEAAFLGADSYAVDSNELSVFVQQIMLDRVPRAQAPGFTSLLEESGERVLSQLATGTDALFPLRSKVATYLWTYSMKCSGCGYRFYLMKRPWLSKKKGKRLAMLLENGPAGQTVSLRNVEEGFAHRGTWVGRNGTVACPECSRVHKNISIKQCRDELVATVTVLKKGKAFAVASGGEGPRSQQVSRIERQALKALDAEMPASLLPRWSGIVNPSLYGIETHADFLNPRQRAVLLVLLKALDEEYRRLAETAGVKTAKAVVGLLSGFVDQVVDWNCRLSMWISQNEQVGRAFCGPGVAMMWDYAETDPVGDGPANLRKKLKRIVAGARSILQLPKPCHVRHAYAQQLPYQDAFFDAVVTDPPYYDNIFYTVLADFFFSWKRLLFQRIEPGLFEHEGTDSTHELVASAKRTGGRDEAHVAYCHELGRAVSEAARVLKPDGVFAMVYSHSSLRGWEALIRAYRPSGLWITSVQPLSIERKQRPRAMNSEAVNTCVVFVARPRTAAKKIRSVEAISSEVAVFADRFGHELLAAGWVPRDVAVAVYAQAVGMLINVSSVAGCSNDMEALDLLAMMVAERFPGFSVSKRGSL